MADEQAVQIGTEAPTAAEQEKTFTQADVDRMIQTRLDRERKKYPTEDEMTGYRNWKASRQTEQERWNNLTGERDTARTALTAAQAEIEQLKRDNYILSKGLSGEDAEFIAFKAAKMVDEKTTFEQAVDSIVESAGKRVGFDWTAPLSGSGETAKSRNQQMNALIRGAFK